MDPVSVGIGKAAEGAIEGLSKAAGELLIRAFGPPADVVGEYLRRKTDYRLNNAERIAEVANQKALKQGRTGTVPPRLSYVMLEDGTYSDDELMAEYLGGVLAAGRTPSGKDDRGVTWTKLITSMSVLQLRTHFILYREWAFALRGFDKNLGQDSGRRRAQMYVDLEDLIPVLQEVAPEAEVNSILSHVISGLQRWGLIEGDYQYGPVAEIRPTGSVPADLPFSLVARLNPSPNGMELYGWACGLPGLAPTDFIAAPELVSIEVDIPRPKVVLADLSLPE